MKLTKKLMVAVLAVAAALAMSTVAFAADTEYSVTVTNDNPSISIDGKEYQAYKVFDLSYNGDANAYSISSTNQFYTDTATKAVIDEYFTLTQTASDNTKYTVSPKNDPMTEADARAFADKLTTAMKGKTFTPDGTATAVNESAAITVSGPGYYAITGSAAPASDATKTIIAALALNNAKPAVTINVKADAPSLDKTIADAQTIINDKIAASDLGKVITFKVEADIPDMTGYSAYTYKVSDTMTSGLTFNDDIAVTVDGVAYTNYTKTATTNGFVIDFTNFISLKDKAGKKIVVTYSGTVNTNALTKDVEVNEAWLDYSNDPADYTKTIPTPPSYSYVFDFDINIDKVAAGTSTKLPGAKFVLKNADGKYYKLTNGVVSWVDTEEAATEVTTNADGFASFQGIQLCNATYYLHETAAPEGYNPLTTDPVVTVTATFDADGQLLESNVTNENNGQYHLDSIVENNSGEELPVTGGMGTTLFYVVGAILVIGAAVVMITRRRMGSEE